MLHLKNHPTLEILRSHLPEVRRSGTPIAVGCLATPPRVAVFDLDATIIPCEFIDELAARRGLDHHTRALTLQAMNGEIDFRESYLRRLEMLKGTPVAEIDRLIDQLPLAPGAARAICAIHAAGTRTAIITGGYARLGRAIQKRLGIGALYATELEERDGLLTGHISGALMDEEAKAAALTDFCRLRGCSPTDAVAVGDGANDLGMLSAAGLAILYTSMPASGRTITPLDAVLEFCL